MNNSQEKPIARKDGLVIQEMPDEILVYDLETNKAHCLNETAAFVWRACDGKNSVADIVQAFGNQSGRPVPENFVWLAIDQLNECKLLAEELKADFRGQSRREVIKKVGLAAVISLPVVLSLVAPPAALAVACSSPNGTSCGGTNICCGGQCCVTSNIASQCTGVGTCTQ